MPIFRLRRPKIAVGVIGQSNQRGQVSFDEAIGGVKSKTQYPQAFRSLRNPGIRYPLSPAGSLYGGMWFKLYDDLWDWGYDAEIVNGGIGSASMIRDLCGQCQTRANSTAYRQRRAPSGLGDNGYAGDFMVAQGRVFLCTRGVLAYATAMSSDSGSATAGDLDFTRIVGTNATAAAEPAGLATAAVGDVVIDGTVEWTCMSTTTAYAGYSYGAGGILNHVRVGFDPFGIVRGVLRDVQGVRNAARRFVILANGESDTGNANLAYQQAVEAIGTYLAQRGVGVVVGLSAYTPTASTANYSALSGRIAGALTNLRNNAGDAYDAADIITGADLYQLMGSTGDMAAGGANFAKDAQQDNIHLNARGAIVGGGHWANALKAALPELATGPLVG